MTEARQEHLKTTEADLRRKLEQTFGRMMSSKQIGQLLVYPSPAAFRQAVHRGAVNIRMFTLPERRGRFAMTADVARWLAAHVEAGASPSSRTDDGMEQEDAKRSPGPPLDKVPIGRGKEK